MFLVSYRDVRVEEDSVPLLLLEPSTPPRSLGELVVGRDNLRERFANWLRAELRGP